MVPIKLMIAVGILTWAISTRAEPLDPFNRLRQKVPRIGRRGQVGIVSDDYEEEGFPMSGSLSSFFLKSAKSIPRIGRRKDVLEPQDENAWPAKLALESDGLENIDPSHDGRELYKLLIDHWLQQRKEGAAME